MAERSVEKFSLNIESSWWSSRCGYLYSTLCYLIDMHMKADRDDLRGMYKETLPVVCAAVAICQNFEWSKCRSSWSCTFLPKWDLRWSTRIMLMQNMDAGSDLRCCTAYKLMTVQEVDTDVYLGRARARVQAQTCQQSIPTCFQIIANTRACENITDILLCDARAFANRNVHHCLKIDTAFRQSIAPCIHCISWKYFTTNHERFSELDSANTQAVEWNDGWSWS